MKLTTALLAILVCMTVVHDAMAKKGGSVFSVPFKTQLEVSAAANLIIENFNYANIHKKFAADFKESFDEHMTAYKSSGDDRIMKSREEFFEYSGNSWAFPVDRIHVVQDWSVGSEYAIAFHSTVGGRLAPDNKCLIDMQVGWHARFNRDGFVTHISAIWDDDVFTSCGVPVKRKNRAQESVPNDDMAKFFVDDLNSAFELYFNGEDGPANKDEGNLRGYFAENLRTYTLDNHLTEPMDKEATMTYLRDNWADGTAVFKMGRVQSALSSGDALMFKAVAHGFAEGSDCHLEIPYSGIYFLDSNRRLTEVNQLWGDVEPGKMMCPPKKDEL